MIDLEREHLISLAQAAKLRPAGRQGRPTHVSTVYRWISRGVRGHRLEAIRLGGAWYTSVSALQRFANLLSHESVQIPLSTPTDQSPSQVDSALNKIGI